MSENGKFEEQQEKIVKTLATMFDYLGLTGTFRVEEKGTKIAVKIASEDAGRIIGRKGQTLDSLQLLLNRIMFKENEEFPHVLLDIDGYAKNGTSASRVSAVSAGVSGTEKVNAVLRSSWKSRLWTRPRRSSVGEKR